MDNRVLFYFVLFTPSKIENLWSCEQKSKPISLYRTNAGLYGAEMRKTGQKNKLGSY
jgi:hypothetical protein